MTSDWQRALAALFLTAGLGAGLTGFAPELRENGLLPAPQPETELLYSIVNLTEDIHARTACPLDLAAARARVEAGGPGAEACLQPDRRGPRRADAGGRGPADIGRRWHGVWLDGERRPQWPPRTGAA